jgi:hypothetical protein
VKLFPQNSPTHPSSSIAVLATHRRHPRSEYVALCLIAIALSCLVVMGEAAPAVKSVSCKQSSYLAAGTDACTVTLTEVAASSGLSVTLKSNTSEAIVPESLKIAAGKTTGTFSATIKPGLTDETATLTASGGDAKATFPIKLVGDQYRLEVSTASLPFGDSEMSKTPTQSIVLKSTGKDTLTISSAKITSASFHLENVSFPVKIAAGKSVTWEIEFKPISLGTHAGHIAITSDSDTGTTSNVELTGTGIEGAYSVDLRWDTPSDSSVKIAGYRVYRAVEGSSSYEPLSSTLVTETAYADGTVKDGTTYEYYVESVDSAGVSSKPSSIFSVAIP